MALPNILFHDGGKEREVYARATHPLGTKLITQDGREFRYARAGATALAVGKLMQSEVPGADMDTLAVAEAAAIGANRVKITTGSTAITDGMFSDGYLSVEDSTGAGHTYFVKNSPAIGTTSDGYITLAAGNALKIALTTSSKVTLVKHPLADTIIHPSPPTAAVVGVTPVAVPAGYYYWSQVRGVGTVLGTGTLVIGTMVVASQTVDGSVDPYVATGDNSAPIGQVIEVAATTKYSLVALDIPGF